MSEDCHDSNNLTEPAIQRFMVQANMQTVEVCLYADHVRVVQERDTAEKIIRDLCEKAKVHHPDMIIAGVQNAERERCARIAEYHNDTEQGEIIAAAIRHDPKEGQ
jgi:hypothetical protein